jgi:hypothetical protein
MTKLAIPDGVTQQEYWETLKRDATNDKFCNLRASMKNKLFNQFKGMYIDTNKSVFLLMPILFACFVFAEDEHIRWCPPVDNSRKILVESRPSWTKPRATSLTYTDTEKFLRFIDKIVQQAVGNHNLSKWMKFNGSKTLLDRITPSDIAYYTIILYENSIYVWREELEIKATSKTKEERQSARRHQKPRYHHASGKCIKHHSDGWTCWQRVLDRIAQAVQNT